MRHSVIILLCLFLAGCVAPPPTYYATPPNLTPDFAATVEGSEINQGGPNPASILVTVTSIDGALTTGDQLRRVEVTPGLHTIVFTGAVTAPPQEMASGWLKATVTLAPGTSYYLTSSGIQPGQYLGPNYLSVWLINGAGQQVSTIAPLYLLPAGPQTSGGTAPANDQPDPIFIPDDHNGDWHHDESNRHAHDGWSPGHNFIAPPLQLPPPHDEPPAPRYEPPPPREEPIHPWFGNKK